MNTNYITAKNSRSRILGSVVVAINLVVVAINLVVDERIFQRSLPGKLDVTTYDPIVQIVLMDTIVK